MLKYNYKIKAVNFVAYDDVSKPVKDFLFYLDVVNGKSKNTIYEYYLDIRGYLKFLYKMKNKLSCEISEVDAAKADIDFIKQITLEDTYEYLYYLKSVKNCNNRTLNRKICSIHVFFKFLSNKSSFDVQNPVENLENNSLPYTLPKHLSLEECEQLLNATDGKNSKRDYAMLVLFLNCGLRLSELVSINLSDLGNEYLTITGKGNKQRSLYLNRSCLDALDDYIKKERPRDGLHSDARNALFISRNGNRISRRAVQNVVENCLKKAGLGDKNYSTHKLRHTAATLMHKYGNVDIRVLQQILGHENLGTTQIYTHVDSEQVKIAVNANPVSKIKHKEKNE